eukprot:3846517-Pyramimonas_sp.AAC.1
MARQQKYVMCNRRGCKGWTWCSTGARHCDQCGGRFKSQQYVPPGGARGSAASNPGAAGGAGSSSQPPSPQPTDKPGRWRGRDRSRGPSHPPGLRRPGSVTFAHSEGQQPQEEDPVALAQAQVTFWKKWTPNGQGLRPGNKVIGPPGAISRGPARDPAPEVRHTDHGDQDARRGHPGGQWAALQTRRGSQDHPAGDPEPRESVQHGQAGRHASGHKG